ncbi:hypothetical protein phytr_580 [Candidatus Phycorickettsia trachydisci]|uniref:Uncharacterized protein n=1 Tax=Candidatus Phycorickettsia trachydisci TaxID=2115978 RepID=A0A2P1P6Y2_9RICK|nr:hypothetical protein [Candidatus Phycorickettsia trachydisci]AVP87021.1 hypothetical protein phytr_580 [Candidatus Phycorickettsia trachydisci]
METEIQEQDKGFLPLDILIHGDMEGIMGDALMLLSIHTTREPSYLETVKYICKTLSVDHSKLNSLQKNIIKDNITYLMVQHKIPMDDVSDLVSFLKHLDINMIDLPETINLQNLLLSKFDIAADIINKALTKHKVSKRDIDNFLIKRIQVSDLIENISTDKENNLSKMAKKMSFQQIVRFFTDIADYNTFIDFKNHIQSRPIPVDCSLRIETKLFYNFLSKGSTEECLKLLPQIDTLIQDIKKQENIDLESKSSISNALFTEALYHMNNAQTKLAMHKILEAIEVYPPDSFRNADSTILNIDNFKTYETKKFWLDKLIQAWPLEAEIKTVLLEWFLTGYVLKISLNTRLLKKFEDLKLNLQANIKIRELNNAIDSFEIYTKISFYALNYNIEEVENLLANLAINKYIPSEFKYTVQINTLRFISRKAAESIIPMIVQLKPRDDDFVYNLVMADVYINLADNVPEKAVEYSIKISNYIQKANLLFKDGTHKNYLKAVLINLNKSIALKSFTLSKEYQEYIDFLENIGENFTIIEDHRSIHEKYQALKKEAEELQKRDISGEPEVVYSWKIGNQIYESTNPDVVLIDPDQLIFGINDLRATEQELAPFDESLRKGFIADKKQGKGLKLIPELSLIEAKDNSGNRLTYQVIHVNPEGAKLIISKNKLTHKGVKIQTVKPEGAKKQSDKMYYQGCKSETCPTLPDLSKHVIKWQEVYGLAQSTSSRAQTNLGGGRSI